MNTELQMWDRRSSERTPLAGKLWWLGEYDENFTLAWSTDQSQSGIAFVTTGGESIRSGQKLMVTRTNPSGPWPDCETLRVCRVDTYGPYQQLVACTRTS